MEGAYEEIGNDFEIAQAELARKANVARLDNRIAAEPMPEPRIGDRIVVFDEKWAKLIVSGDKDVEIRSHKMKANLGDPIYIAAKQDKDQGRRAWVSPFYDERPRKSRILGMVRFHEARLLEWEEFDRLSERHHVPGREAASRFANKNDNKVRGWFFTDPVKCEEREYKINPGTRSRRTFLGWD